MTTNQKQRSRQAKEPSQKPRLPAPSLQEQVTQFEEPNPLALRRAVADPAIAAPSDLLALQDRYGNRAVQRLLVQRQDGDQDSEMEERWYQQYKLVTEEQFDRIERDYHVVIEKALRMKFLSSLLSTRELTAAKMSKIEKRGGRYPLAELQRLLAETPADLLGTAHQIFARIMEAQMPQVSQRTWVFWSGRYARNAAETCAPSNALVLERTLGGPIEAFTTLNRKILGDPFFQVWPEVSRAYAEACRAFFKTRNIDIEVYLGLGAENPETVFNVVESAKIPTVKTAYLVQEIPPSKEKQEFEGKVIKVGDQLVNVVPYGSWERVLQLLGESRK
jgi:hypothetical protein